MCHLIMDASADVQRMAYQLLYESARKYTEHMVIEAAVDSEAAMSPALPEELIGILQQYLDLDGNIERNNQVNRVHHAMHVTDSFCRHSLAIYLAGWLPSTRS